ncbi:ALK and LTK ligand 2 isoform X1 [Chroicocephalus ridibundus]
MRQRPPPLPAEVALAARAPFPSWEGRRAEKKGQAAVAVPCPRTAAPRAAHRPYPRSCPQPCSAAEECGGSSLGAQPPRSSGKKKLRGKLSPLAPAPLLRRAPRPGRGEARRGGAVRAAGPWRARVCSASARGEGVPPGTGAAAERGAAGLPRRRSPPAARRRGCRSGPGSPPRVVEILPQQRILPFHLLVRPSGQTAMSGLRSPGLLGLVLLMLSAGYCKEKTDSADLKDRQSLLNLIMEIIQELKRYHLEKDSGVQYFSKHDYNLDRREVADYGGYQDEQRVEIVPRDLRMKDKFLKHLTGPLYFSPKCSKHFHRLYHNTRDCTIPAYYKRCARLLTRLAVSPMCMEG